MNRLLEHLGLRAPEHEPLAVMAASARDDLFEQHIREAEQRLRLLEWEEQVRTTRRGR